MPGIFLNTVWSIGNKKMWPYKWNVWRDAKESHPAPGACKSAPWPKPNLIKFRECVLKKKKCAKCVAACDSVTFASARFSLCGGSSGGRVEFPREKGSGRCFTQQRSHLYCSLCADSGWKRRVWEAFLRATLEERWSIFTATSKRCVLDKIRHENKCIKLDSLLKVDEAHFNSFFFFFFNATH